MPGASTARKEHGDETVPAGPAWQRYIRENKPADDPGTFTDEAALELTAYILSRNGVPAGEVALTAETAARALFGPEGWDGMLPDAARWCEWWDAWPRARAATGW